MVAGGVSQIREISGGSGYASQDAMVASFGLGGTATVDSLIVTWPSGIVQVVSPVPTANTVQTVREPGFFEDVAAGTPLADVGNGSGVAWGDYDNDGDLDLYLTRISEANQLFRNEGNNTFTDATAGTPLGDTGSGFSAVVGRLRPRRRPRPLPGQRQFDEPDEPAVPEPGGRCVRGRHHHGILHSRPAGRSGRLRARRWVG